MVAPEMYNIELVCHEDHLAGRPGISYLDDGGYQCVYITIIHVTANENPAPVLPWTDTRVVKTCTLVQTKFAGCNITLQL